LRGVTLLNCPDSNWSRKRVPIPTPSLIVRNLVTPAGTITSIRRVLFALEGRVRTVLPSLARMKNTRLLRTPFLKFLPLITSFWPTRTCAGENDVMTGAAA
jgi:hypothetical protein